MNHFTHKIIEMLPARLFLDLHFFKIFHRFPNWKSPQTYSEKIQWMKLYDHNPLYTRMVDKFTAKDYVAQIVGHKYIIPLIGVWDKAEDIDWESLPRQFVIKTNNGGGGIRDVRICKDKQKASRDEYVAHFSKLQTCSQYWYSKEWAYKDVPFRIIAEKYIEGIETLEYRFFCFDGIVKMIHVKTKANGVVYVDCYDRQFQPLDIIHANHTKSMTPIGKPQCLDEMIEVAERLSAGFPHIRVDLYEKDNTVLFGELTLYSSAGLAHWHPSSWDKVMGDWFTLPKRNTVS